MESTVSSLEDSKTSSSSNDEGKQPSDENERKEDTSEYVSSFSDLPEVVPADTFQGIEVLKNENDYMEVVPGQGKESAYIEHLPETWDVEGGKESLPYGTPLDPTSAANDQLPKSSDNGSLNRRICGIRMRWVILAIAALVVLILVLGIGLGVGLHSGGSKPGALTGTKISLVAQPYINGGGSDHSLVMYFQHRTGQIRWMGLDNNGKWTGGDSSTLVAGDAKPGTPISAVSYTWDGATFWRLYYINTANTLQETWGQNTREGQWALGPLSSMNISPLDSSNVGLTACWFGSTSGSDKDYQGAATTTDAKDVEVRLTYAEDEKSFRIMQYIATTQKWTTEQVLSGLDGHASPACHNRQPGTVDYYMFVNEQNAVNVYWIDRSQTLANTTEHPIGVWTNSSISIPNISLSASLGYENALYAQDSITQVIDVYNITFNAESSKVQTNSDFSMGDETELPSTGLGIAVQSSSGNSDELLVFYQTDENQIVEYKRKLSDGGAGGWSSSEIHIPYN